MGQPDEFELIKWPVRIGISLALAIVALGVYRTFVLDLGVKHVPGLPPHLMDPGNPRALPPHLIPDASR